MVRQRIKAWALVAAPGHLMISVHGRRDTLDTLAIAYLEKYPSGIDAAFPLFQPPLSR